MTLKQDLVKLISDECPVWEQQFDAGPGIVCSVDDAAQVVSQWIESTRGVVIDHDTHSLEHD